MKWAHIFSIFPKKLCLLVKSSDPHLPTCLPAAASGNGDEGEADSRRPGGGCQADGATEGRRGPGSYPQKAEDRRRGGAGQRVSGHHGAATARGEVRHP